MKNFETMIQFTLMTLAGSATLYAGIVMLNLAINFLI